MRKKWRMVKKKQRGEKITEGEKNKRHTFAELMADLFTSLDDTLLCFFLSKIFLFHSGMLSGISISSETNETTTKWAQGRHTVRLLGLFLLLVKYFLLPCRNKRSGLKM